MKYRYIIKQNVNKKSQSHSQNENNYGFKKNMDETTLEQIALTVWNKISLLLKQWLIGIKIKLFCLVVLI